MTLKKLVKQILEVSPECRNDYRKLIWRVWEESGFVDRNFNTISFESFMKAPKPESIRRPAQNDFRVDRLTGKNEIQPSRNVRKMRDELAKEKGASLIMAKQSYIFNPLTQTYE